MSFEIEIRASEKTFMTQIPPSALTAFGNLEKRGYKQDVQQLVINVDGEERRVARLELLAAIDRLAEPAKSMGSGFRIRYHLSFGDQREQITESGGGFAGALIDGIYFGFRCYDDYWKMSPSGPDWPATVPLEMRGLHRYEPAEFQSENMGVIKIERERLPRKEPARLLTEIAEFLRSVEDEFVTIIVG
jgi:hypothetical protein